MAYNYKKEITADCVNAIEEYLENNKGELRGMSKSQLEEKLYDQFFVEDSVTGNASGSYTFNTVEAENNLAGNWDLAAEAMKEFGCEENPFEKGAEWVDVTIRCYLLSECLQKAMKELSDEIDAELEDID